MLAVKKAWCSNCSQRNSMDKFDQNNSLLFALINWLMHYWAGKELDSDSVVAESVVADSVVADSVSGTVSTACSADTTSSGELDDSSDEQKLNNSKKANINNFFIELDGNTLLSIFHPKK